MYHNTIQPPYSFLPGFPVGTRFPQFDSCDTDDCYEDTSILDLTPVDNMSSIKCKTPVLYPTPNPSEASQSQISSPSSRPQSSIQIERKVVDPFHPPFRPGKPIYNNGVSGTGVFNSPLYNTKPTPQNAFPSTYSQDEDGRLAEEVANSVLQSPGLSKRRVSHGHHGITMKPLDLPNSLFKQTWCLLIDFANKSSKQWDLVFGSRSVGPATADSPPDTNGFREVGHITDCSLRDLFDSLYSFIHVLYDFYQTRRHISISTTVYEGLISDIRSIGKQFTIFAAVNTKDGAQKAASLCQTWDLIDTLYVSKYRLEEKTCDRSIQTLLRLAAEKKALFEMYVRTVESYFLLDNFREYFSAYANTVETEHLSYRKYGAKLILSTWELCKALALEGSIDDLVIDRITNVAFELKKIAVPYSLHTSWNFASAYNLARNMDDEAVRIVTESRSLFPSRNEDFLDERNDAGYGTCGMLQVDAQPAHLDRKTGEGIAPVFDLSRLQNSMIASTSPDDHSKVTCAGSAVGSIGNAATSHMDEKAPIYAIYLRILILACLKKHSPGNLAVQPPINIIRNTAYRLPRDILGRSGSSQDAAIQFRNAILDPNNLLSRGDKVLMEASVSDLAKAVLWKCKEGRWQWLKEVFRDVVGLDAGQIPISVSDTEALEDTIGSRKISLI